MGLGQLVSDLAFVGAMLALAAGSVGAVVARKSMHIVSWLVVASLGVAAGLALLGYSYISVFHVVVYIGTAVTLLALVIMLLGCSVEGRPWRPGRLIISFFAAAALLTPILVYAGSTVSHARASIAEAAQALLRCWFCTLLMVITLATVVIEAVAIARSGRGGVGE